MSLDLTSYFQDASDRLAISNLVDAYATHPDGRSLDRTKFSGARALRGKKVVPSIELLDTPNDGPSAWMQVSAVPLCDRYPRYYLA